MTFLSDSKMNSAKNNPNRAKALLKALAITGLIGCGISAAHADVGNTWVEWDADGEADSWDQPFDRSFAKQWEMHPERGYPTLARSNIGPMKAAIKKYARIAAKGGWKRLPMVKLEVGTDHEAVALLRRRLVMTGDLEQESGFFSSFDYYVEKGVRRFQMRHGLTPTGVVDKATIMALNVPASARLRQLRTNLARFRALPVSKAKRYVMVNIPAAQIEAVENNQVVSRHSGVVGKIDRQTPALNAQIHELNFNPRWTLPPTVITKDLIPKGREMSRRKKQTDVLTKYRIDAYSGGRKLDPKRINWHSPAVYKYVYRQEPGDDNPLGFVKINFHNKYAVFLHDTPSKALFGRNFRAASSGCVRVQNVQQLVTWLLKDNSGWNRDRVAQLKRTGEQTSVRLKRRVPLFMVYLTAWATQDGTANFRRDLYRRDGVGATASAY